MHRLSHLTSVLFTTLAAALTATAGTAWACGTDQVALPDPVDRALSAHPADAGPAREALRAAGPEGLERLQDAHADAIAALRRGEPTVDTDFTLRLTDALDAVAGQKDAAFSGLYWYEDLTAARAQAHRTGRPILSLHLLGKLTDEKSCANSRFFRTVLYPDPAVNTFLRDNFVLHWHSVRPVPTLSVDLGDGRRVERTITGNSVHYVLDAEGHVIDGIPGLVSANAFVSGLQQALGRERGLATQGTEAIARQTWQTGLTAAADAGLNNLLFVALAQDGAPPAERAMALTFGKSTGRSPPPQRSAHAGGARDCFRHGDRPARPA